jgi:hypothetical protein
VTVTVTVAVMIVERCHGEIKQGPGMQQYLLLVDQAVDEDAVSVLSNGRQ